MMLSFDKAISKVLPSITRVTVPTISAAIAVTGISIARQQTRTVVLVWLRFKVGSNPTFFRRARGRRGVQSDLAGAWLAHPDEGGAQPMPSSPGTRPAVANSTKPKALDDWVREQVERSTL